MDSMISGTPISRFVSAQKKHQRCGETPWGIEITPLEQLGEGLNTHLGERNQRTNDEGAGGEETAQTWRPRPRGSRKLRSESRDSNRRRGVVRKGVPFVREKRSGDARNSVRR